MIFAPLLSTTSSLAPNGSGRVIFALSPFIFVHVFFLYFFSTTTKHFILLIFLVSITRTISFSFALIHSGLCTIIRVRLFSYRSYFGSGTRRSISIIAFLFILTLTILPTSDRPLTTRSPWNGQFLSPTHTVSGAFTSMPMFLMLCFFSVIVSTFSFTYFIRSYVLFVIVLQSMMLSSS